VKRQGTLLIKNANQLLTMSGNDPGDLGLVPDGWLYADGGIIAAVGSRESVEPLAAEADIVIDAGGKTVLPGFVDCHTHVVFGGSRVREYAVKLTDNDPETLSRLGIKTGIYASVEMTRDLSSEALAAQSERRLMAMLSHGTTTVESKSGYGLSLESELRMLEVNHSLNQRLAIDIVSCFLGAHGWPAGTKK
jgi:imidazolonepropionase